MTGGPEGHGVPGRDGGRPLRGRRRRRGCLFALIALALLVSVLALVLEVGARLLWTLPPEMSEFQQAGLYVATPAGGTGLVPGYRGTLQVAPAEPVTRVAINALGMRGAEVGPKQPGERRLLCVGDSLVFGYGVEAEETFAARLQARLRSDGDDATVGNGGISGFSSFEAAQRIADLWPAFAPDAVLFCCYLGNDAFENRSQDVEIVGGQRFVGGMARLLRTSSRARFALQSRFWLWVETWLVNNRPGSSLLARIPPDDKAGAALAGFPGAPTWGATHAGLFLDVADERTAWPEGAPPVLPRVLGDFRAALTQAVQAAATLPVVVLILPTWWHVDARAYEARLRELQFDPGRFRRGAMQERLRQLGRELGLTVHDATPWLEAADDPAAMFLSDHGHLSPRGHLEVAQKLAPIVRALWH